MSEVPSAPAETTLAVVVPATDDPPTLAGCLAAISSAIDPPAEITVVREPAGTGPAEARNRGARASAADVLVFVDADVEVHPDAFRRIVEAFRSDPGLTALFGAYDDAPSAPGAVSGFRNLLHHHVHTTAAGPATTFWAGLGAVRRDAFLAVGGFDAQRFPRPSVEDVDLGLRLRAAGGRIRLDPELRGTHAKAWTLSEMLRTDVLARGAPWVRLLLEARSVPASLNLGWRHRASAVLSVVGLRSLGRRQPVGAAAALLGLVALNHSFYALLIRRRGPREAGVGVGLHVLHHLAALAAVPVGAFQHWLGGRGARRTRKGPAA